MEECRWKSVDGRVTHHAARCHPLPRAWRGERPLRRGESPHARRVYCVFRHRRHGFPGGRYGGVACTGHRGVIEALKQFKGYVGAVEEACHI